MTVTIPFVTTAAFQAHPTFLDLLNLRSGDASPGHQTQELYNILLMSSAWVENYCEQPLQAATRTDFIRTRIDRAGRLKHHPDHIPVISFTGLSFGPYPNQLTALTDFSNTWVEDQRQLIAYAAPLSLTSSAGPLQFGGITPDLEMYCQWTYVSGWVNTVMTTSPSAGASAFGVADVTGLVAGTVLRLWEPGLEESVTVSSVVGTTVNITGTLLNTHTATSGVSSLPPDIHLATILYGTALLLRPDTSGDDPFADSHMSMSTRVADSRKDGSGLVLEAERLLETYRRVR